jgi:S-adenosylmethionine synthetase
VTERRFFTSNSVLRGHPDKLCDRISDAIVDAHLALDTHARVRAEVTAAGQIMFVTTDVYSSGAVDVTGLVRRTLAETGYDPADLDAERCVVLTQSSPMTSPWGHEPHHADLDPATLGASEQATVFGYACAETPERMPLPIRVAHRLAADLDRLAARRELSGLGPDGNVQVTVEYEDTRPVRVDAIVVQVQHRGKPSELEDTVRQLVRRLGRAGLPAAPDRATQVLVNAEGPWLVGGPARDAGHTGRKTQVDTYGGWARHGGSALSGKDPGRIDRAATYAARYAASNVVAASLAAECEVMLSYAIGRPEPTTVSVRTYGSGALPDERLSAVVREVFDLRPAGIARHLRLWTLPRERGGRFYRELAVGGQVGRSDLDLPWEQVDAADKLRAAASALAR